MSEDNGSDVIFYTFYASDCPSLKDAFCHLLALLSTIFFKAGFCTRDGKKYCEYIALIFFNIVVEPTF